MNLIKNSQDELRQIILNALGEGVASGELPAEPIPSFNIEIPADRSHGDFATNVAMVCAKAFRLPPRKIAEIISEKVYLEGSFFSKCEVAGPGFINFFLADKWYSVVIDTVLSEGNSYGRTNLGENKKVMVEFSCNIKTCPVENRSKTVANSTASCVTDMHRACGVGRNEFYHNFLVFAESCSSVRISF